MRAIVELKNIHKHFLHSHALDGLDLSINEGECLGLVGHNGAGKSTLMNILNGTFRQNSGELIVDGAVQAGDYDIVTANRKGIRAVFQELSLCPNLTVFENLSIFHPALRGRGWKKRAAAKIMKTMDAIFPDHGIRATDVVSNLSLGKRQIVEIAKAFTVTDIPLRLVILDEPTSALDYHTSAQLLSYLKSMKSRGVSCVYISHILDEVLTCTDRIVVMKDGKNAGMLETSSASRQQIIALMGGGIAVASEQGKGDEVGVLHTEELRKTTAESAPLVISSRDGSQVTGIKLKLRAGEIVGLAGLAGHGQTQFLMRLFNSRQNTDYRVQGSVTFIPGDRQAEGVFPMWSITKNITLQVYGAIRRFFLIDRKKEMGMAEKWRNIVSIKAASMDSSILSLSGGNQQKAIFARSLGSSAPIVLMDDPTRGVDINTKEEIYRLILDESRRGRSFVWYTTETDELRNCDRVYVFRSNEIIAELVGSEATEDAILKSSF